MTAIDRLEPHRTLAGYTDAVRAAADMESVVDEPSPGSSATLWSSRCRVGRAPGFAAIALGCLFLAPVVPPPATTATTATTATDDPENWRGFVADATCASCHGEIAQSFSGHSMARAFSHPERAHRVETFAEGDALSFEEGDTRYQFVHSDGELQYRRWQVGPDGAPMHLWQRTVDWVLGSGSNSRVYLVQSAEGALYELPIAWYTQTQEFAPTPGTMEVEREGRLRVIRRPCLFCHNAVPADPGFDDHRFAPNFFPRELPEGVGCQRCHGPGRHHVDAARRAVDQRPTSAVERRAVRDAVRATITNPARLDAARRRDVCAQCHHQPAVVLFGQRRLDRGDYEFAAGDRLADFLLKLDVLEAHPDGSPRPHGERFEINHHAYRLEQSPCFLNSPPGSLECTSCHDPHRDQNATETFERARSLCLDCHVDGSTETLQAESTGPFQGEHFSATECVTCHMPRRRTEDIVRVVMTDHLIQRQPEPEAERLAPRTEEQDTVLDVFPLDPDPAAVHPTNDLIRAMGGIRAGSLQLTGDLERLIERARRDQPELDLSEPEMRLARALVQLGREAEAQPILERLRLQPAYSLVATDLAAVASARLGHPERALELLDPLIERHESPPAQLLFNRGAIRLGVGHPGACIDLQRATERNEFLRRAWAYLGTCREAEDDLDGAVAAYRQALRLDPTPGRTTAQLVALLRRTERDAEADRIETHARRQSSLPH